MTTSPTVAELEARVAQGAKLLDGYDPNWALNVSVLSLSLAYCDKCVLGQLFRSYSLGLRTLGIHTHADELDTSVVRLTADNPIVTHGFDLSYDEVYNDGTVAWTSYRQLTDAWRRVVGARQRALPVPVAS